jgi:hypothetical protein
VSYGIYAALNGLLSVPKYRGAAKQPGMEYNLIPSAGLFLGGAFAGMRTGIERYHFGTLLEGAWKMNVTLYLYLRQSNNPHERKEITY